MLYVLNMTPTFTWPVEWETPEASKPVKIKFTGVFKRPSQTEIEELLKTRAANSAAQEGEAQPTENEALNKTIAELHAWHEEIVRTYLVGWTGVGGAGDKGTEDADFDAENLARVLDVLGARAAIANAFLNALAGGKAARKN